MLSIEIWKAVVDDTEDFLDDLIALFDKLGVRYCVIGGQGVNAYVDPLISLDLDFVVAADQIERVADAVAERFRVERLEQSLNITSPGSNLRVQLQLDPRYWEFPAAATRRDVLGVSLPVATVTDILRGKVWAAQDASRRPSKRRKDLLDIERLVEAHPELRAGLPDDIKAKLELE